MFDLDKYMKNFHEEDRIILNMAELPDDYDFDKEFDTVIEWCKKAFARIDKI